MNKILLVALLLPMLSFCQTDSIPQNADGKYEYSEVVNVDSVSAEKLYSNAKLFIVDAFKSGKDVTQLNDEISKTVAGTGAIKIILKGTTGTQYVSFKINIQCKDGRYKYDFSNFQYDLVYYGEDHFFDLEDAKRIKRNMVGKQYEHAMQQVSESMKALIEKLKTQMASQAADW